MSGNPVKNWFSKSLRRKQTLVTSLSVVVFGSALSFVLYQGTKTPVVINTNGEEEKIFTHAETVEELLEEKEVNFSEYDKVSPALETKLNSGMTIEWEQAREVTISVDGNESKVWTTENKVKNILEEANIKVAEHDLISKALDAEIGDTNKIDIQKAFQLTLVDGTTTRQVWSTSTTVANFLKQQEIQLNEFDRVEKDLDAKIIPDDKVTIVRVEKVTDVVEESLDFAVETKSDSSLLKGKEKVVTQGEKGKVSRTYEVIKENGIVVEKVLQSEEVIQQPKTKVVAVGTKVVTANVSRSNDTSSSSGGKEFYVTATAYTPYCNGCSGTSASGINLRNNTDLKVIAVDPSVIPLGTKVWVEGYGNAIAGDTGGSIKGNKIDVLVHSDQQARNWGRKKVRIKILD
ncbi:G5 and 3D domain-containing protein [Lysinibacillus sp. BW-2-10]|uniref:G5 and 3D domain-containing protein n=1 Tax=Lysinibacillus sp. BW-2-10 TaxID=2590030 RepID=UPI0011804BB2|nr:G5 and 3D domain-containing protein [Lysinibacillus sp. BW-2-10]TSI05453.1 DUF348 domain-containing protein [Lysinibacillus sp. BW-2-10]